MRRVGVINKFWIISDFSFAMSEPFDRGYVEWQKRMKDEGYQVVSIVKRQDNEIPLVHGDLEVLVSPWSQPGEDFMYVGHGDCGSVEGVQLEIMSFHNVYF